MDMIRQKINPTSNFKVVETSIDDVFIIEKSKFIDHRGTFVKIFNADAFDLLGLGSTFKETYFSFSNQNVLRGMHYQKSPYGHAKLISVIEGEILDVIIGIGGELNVRNRGKFFSTVLSQDNNRSLYIPDGYAHGFLVLSKRAIILNQTTTVYNAENDAGVHYKSFGFEWPIIDPIISQKDAKLPIFDVF